MESSPRAAEFRSSKAAGSSAPSVAPAGPARKTRFPAKPGHRLSSDETAPASLTDVGAMAGCGNTMGPMYEIDGVDVHVDGSGSPSIVMLHGWPDTYRLWDAQVAAFGSRFTCVRFTLPGFDVDKPRRALSLAQMTGFLKSVVEQTCPGQKVILMLHDWGAFFGYQFAMKH